MFARSPAEVVPRIRQGIDTKKTMVTIFFTWRELIVLDVLAKDSKFNQLYFIDYIFPALKSANLNFRRRKPGSILCVHIDNSTCHHGLKVASKFEKQHIFPLPHPPYSPDINPCDFWLFDLLKGIMKDREFHSHDEIEEAITMAGNDLTFDDVQSVFYDWMRCLALVIENEGEYILE
jgi:transposase